MNDKTRSAETRDTKTREASMDETLCPSPIALQTAAIDRRHGKSAQASLFLASSAFFILTLIGLLFVTDLRAAEPDTATNRTSDNGHFDVAIESRVEPIPLNSLHAWVVSLNTADGTPVDDAAIDVDGGMPMHNHGLPTAPRITEALGDGKYLLEGVKFQMPGHWTVTFGIDADGTTDSVTFNLML